MSRRARTPNDRLRRAREAMPGPEGSGRCMSRQELAEAVNDYLYRTTHRTFDLSANHIGKYERGEVRWPHRHYREGLRAVLGVATDGELGFYVDRAYEVNRGSVSALHGSGGRDALIALAGDSSAPAHTLTALSIDTPHPSAVGWVDVDHVRYLTRALALAENAYGGGFPGQAAAAQLRYSTRLVEAQASNDVRHAMFEAVGNLAGVVGFCAFDVADYASARRCFDFSLWCAAQAGSWDLRANTLGDMARLASYLGDVDQALSLVEFAQVRSDRIAATSRAMLCAVHARLLALTGKHFQAQAAVDHADSYFADRTPPEDPPWISYYDEAEHQGSTARALVPMAVATGRSNDAVTRLQAAVRLHDADHPRSRAFSRTRLASLHMTIGDPKDAVDVGRVALAEAAAVRSARLNAEIEHLGSLADAHVRLPEVAELCHDIAAFSDRGPAGLDGR